MDSEVSFQRGDSDHPWTFGGIPDANCLRGGWGLPAEWYQVPFQGDENIVTDMTDGEHAELVKI